MFGETEGLLKRRLSYSACRLSHCLPSTARCVFEVMCCGVDDLVGEELWLRFGDDCGVMLCARSPLGEFLKIHSSFSVDGGRL